MFMALQEHTKRATLSTEKRPLNLHFLDEVPMKLMPDVLELIQTDVQEKDMASKLSRFIQESRMLFLFEFGLHHFFRI